MANMLDKYVEATDEAAIPASETISKAKRQHVLKKKELKVLKKLAKAFRKYNKKMKQEEEKRKAEGEAAQATTTEKTNKDKSNNGVRGFLVKLGDAVCRAIPKVLTTVVTMALGFLLKTKFAGKAPQGA